MGIWLDAARVAAVANVVLLAVLAGIWVRNYLDLRSKHALALSIFAVLLLGENLLATYYYLVDPDIGRWLRNSAPFAVRAMAILVILELAAIVLLFWATWD